MMEILAAIEGSGWSMYIKESVTAYVAVLAFHSVGMAFLVGISGATALRVLGVARSVPLAPLEDFFPLMYGGLLINAVTGLVLLTLYPTDFLVDVVFYIKLVAIVVAVVTMRGLIARVFRDPASLDTAAGTAKVKVLAVRMLGAWLVAVYCGRVTAYSLDTRVQTAISVVVCVGLFVLIWKVAGRSLGVESSKQGV